MPNRSSSQTDETAIAGDVGGEGRQQFGRRMKVTDLNVVHEGWVLKKKRKKMQGGLLLPPRRNTKSRRS